MLKLDFLKENLAGLTDEQYAKIEQLSQEDERATRELVTRDVTGKLYQNIDDDLKSLGFEKPNGVKTYDFNKQTLNKLKTDYEELKGKLSEIEANGDAETKNLLEQEKSKTATLLQQLNDERRVSAERQSEFDKKMHTFKVQNVMNNAIAGFKVKDGISDTIKNIAFEKAVEQIMKDNTAEFMDDNTVVFKDKDGLVINDPKNGGRPMTAEALLRDSVFVKDILAEDKPRGGAGSNPPAKGNPTGGNLTLANARTKVEANDIIEKMLFDEGYVRGTTKFADRKDEIWKENESVISQLPLQ